VLYLLHLFLFCSYSCLYSPAFFRFTSSITEIFKRVENLKKVRRETHIFFGSSLLLQCHTQRIETSMQQLKLCLEQWCAERRPCFQGKEASCLGNLVQQCFWPEASSLEYEAAPPGYQLQLPEAHDCCHDLIHTDLATAVSLELASNASAVVVLQSFHG
jgi:hypothetical protein